MSWIDEAEKRRDDSVKNKKREELLQQIHVSDNYESFHTFVDEMNALICRVNNLPFSEKKPCLEIGFTEVESRKNYEFFGSAYIYKRGILGFFTGTRYKVLCWRRINFKIADQPNIVKVHIKEQFSETHKGALNKNGEHKDKFKLLITGFDKKLLQQTVNWLTFKCSNHDFKVLLPFAPSSHSH